MLYRFLRFVVPFVLKSHFKNVFIAGAEHVPETGPVIIACSHPNSFLDAVLLAVLLKRPLHFLVRADVFKRPLVARLLAAMHQIPVYRSDSGREGLAKNAETFAECNELFKNNGAVLIFSEGTTIQDKQLRTLRKGTARLAFGALDALPADTEVSILPVAVNYTHHVRADAEVLIGIGKPLRVREWLGQQDKQHPKTLRSISDHLLTLMREQHISVENGPTSGTVEHAFTLLRNQQQFADELVYGKHSRDRLTAEKELAVRIEAMATTQPEAYKRLAEQLQQYTSTLQQHQLQDADTHGNMETIARQNNMRSIRIPSPLALLTYPVRGIAGYISKRTAGDTIFFDSVLAGSKLVLYLVLMISLLVLLGYLALPIILLLPVQDAWSLRSRHRFERKRTLWAWSQLYRTNKEEYKKLAAQRQQLVDILQLHPQA